jgi:hypothetical protein
MEIEYSQLQINHLNDMPSTKAAEGGIFSGVFQQGRQSTNQGQEDLSSVGTSYSNSKAVTVCPWTAYQCAQILCICLIWIWAAV